MFLIYEIIINFIIINPVRLSTSSFYAIILLSLHCEKC